MQGVIYLSTGSSLDLVRNSLGSLRKTNPGLKAHVVCDRPFDGSFTWVKSKRGFSSRYYKTSLDKYSPFELTLYADRDTFFLKPLPPLDELLEGYDIGLTPEPGAHSVGEAEQKLLKHYGREVRATLAEVGRQAPYYNSGVMIWRNSSKVHQFFKCWKNEWLRFRRIDQLALTRAIVNSEISVRALPRPYNYVTRFKIDIEPIPGGWPAATIVHFTQLQKRKGAQGAGFWDPLPAGPYESAFTRAYEHFGTDKEPAKLARMIHERGPCDVLVIGASDDAELWWLASGRRAAFLGMIDTLPNHLPSEATIVRVGSQSELLDQLRTMRRPWDFIIFNMDSAFDRSSVADALCRYSMLLHTYPSRSNGLKKDQLSHVS